MFVFVPLTQKICQYFPLHPSRKKTLVSIILGAMCSGNVYHQSLVRHINSPNLRAAQRQSRTFFSQEELSINDYAQTLVSLLTLQRKF
jgi:hypothetical protein